MSEPRIFNLANPVKAYGNEVTQLELREPSTADVRAINALPYVFSAVGDGQPTPIPEVCAKYISRLAGIPLGAVDQLAFTDFQALSWEITNCFLQHLAVPMSPTSSDTPSTPPISGN